MWVRSITLCLGLVVGWGVSPGQAIEPGSSVLEAYIREGLANNLALRQQRLQVSSAVGALRQAKALFYPQLKFAPTYSVAFGGRRLAFPVGDMLNPAYEALNELTEGSRFPTNIQNINELLAPHNFHDTKVSFQYAIYNPEVRYNYLIQQSLLSAEEARTAVIEDELRFAISEAYFQYFQATGAAKIYEESRKTLLEVVRLNHRLVANQVMTKDAVLSAEYELSVLEKELIEAEMSVKTAGAYFNFLLNKPFDSEVIVDSTLANQVIGQVWELDELIASSLSNRSEIKQLGFSLNAAEQAERLQQKSASVPSFFIGGNAGFQGYGYRFSNQGYMVAQVGLQWDLFKGFERKSKIAQAQVKTETLKVKQTEVGRQIALEVTQSYYAVNAALAGLKVAEAGLEKAGGLYSIVDSRYRNQQVLMLEHQKARNDLQTARLQYSLAKYELLMRTAHLERVSGIQ